MKKTNKERNVIVIPMVNTGIPKGPSCSDEKRISRSIPFMESKKVFKNREKVERIVFRSV